MEGVAGFPARHAGVLLAISHKMGQAISAEQMPPGEAIWRSSVASHRCAGPVTISADRVTGSLRLTVRSMTEPPLSCHAVLPESIQQNDDGVINRAWSGSADNVNSAFTLSNQLGTNTNNNSTVGGTAYIIDGATYAGALNVSPESLPIGWSKVVSSVLPAPSK